MIFILWTVQYATVDLIEPNSWLPLYTHLTIARARTRETDHQIFVYIDECLITVYIKF